MFSRRYLAMWCAVVLLAVCALLAATQHISWFWIIVPVALVALGLFDLTQQHHAILRNYPLWGHFRFLFEFIRPEIRQYFFHYSRRNIRRVSQNPATQAFSVHL